MNNPIIRKVNLISTYRPLATTSMIGNFTIRVPANASDISLEADDKTDMELDRGQQFTLEGVDLSSIQAKGGLGDFLIIIGATRFM